MLIFIHQSKNNLFTSSLSKLENMRFKNFNTKTGLEFWYERMNRKKKIFLKWYDFQE